MIPEDLTIIFSPFLYHLISRIRIHAMVMIRVGNPFFMKLFFQSYWFTADDVWRITMEGKLYGTQTFYVMSATRLICVTQIYIIIEFETKFGKIESIRSKMNSIFYLVFIFNLFA